LNITRSLNHLGYLKHSYYRWLRASARTEKILLCLLIAGVTGIAAQIRIPLPFTPVPITGQVLIVLLAGILLGHIYGGISMFFYFMLGCCGIPWFSGGVSGIPFGPTTGYIIGFIPATFLIGWFTRHFRQAHKFLFLAGLMIIGVVIIYLCGALFFTLLMKTTLSETLTMTVIPFIPGDLIKAFIAACIGRSLLPNNNP
jgi:biotin transport system substrate-specific component